MSQNQSQCPSPRSDAARPNEIESILYNEIVRIQSQLNELVCLLKQTRESGNPEVWASLVRRHADLIAVQCKVNMLVDGLKWDMGIDKDKYLACGDG